MRFLASNRFMFWKKINSLLIPKTLKNFFKGWLICRLNYSIATAVDIYHHITWVDGYTGWTWDSIHDRNTPFQTDGGIKQDMIQVLPEYMSKALSCKIQTVWLILTKGNMI
jgi:hypothetical protein